MNNTRCFRAVAGRSTLVLCMALVFAAGVQAKGRKASTLEVLQTVPSAAEPLSQDDTIEATLSYSLARGDRGASFEIAALLWSTEPPSSHLRPVEVLSEAPLTAPTGSAKVVFRMSDAYEGAKIAHPVRLRFVLNKFGADKTSTIIAKSELLTLETDLKRTAWKDPAWIAEKLEAGEPVPFSEDLGMTTPKRLKGSVPRFEPRLGGQVGIYKLTIATDGHVSSVQVLRPIAAAVDAQAMKELRHWVFRPVKIDGTPVPVTYTVTFRFE